MLDVLGPPYFQQALLAGLLLSGALGLLGVWVVLRELAFFSHAVGVATFPGLVAGAALPILGPFAGALLAALGFSAAVSAVESDHRLRGGAVTGLALAAALAAGGVLLTLFEVRAGSLERLLFGSLLAVSPADVVRGALALSLAVAVVGLALPRLAATTFDAAWAAPAGAGERATRWGFLAFLAVVVVCALPAVGSLLVSAVLVVPAATARLLSERLAPMLVWSGALAAVETATGIVGARVLDVPPGAAVAVAAGAVFAVVAAGRGALDRRSRERPA